MIVRKLIAGSAACLLLGLVASTPTICQAQEHTQEIGVSLHLSDSMEFAETISYPNCVSTDPGVPQKPLIDRPGDRDQSDCPPKRYRMPANERAGNPTCIAPWARCAITKNYSVCYVGGGNAWILPWTARARKRYTEGTWGLDYDGIFKPRRVWMNWSCGREQGGIGQYQTDFEPHFLSFLKSSAH